MPPVGFKSTALVHGHGSHQRAGALTHSTTMSRTVQIFTWILSQCFLNYITSHIADVGQF